MPVLPLPVVMAVSAVAPIPILKLLVDIAFNANRPRAILSVPVREPAFIVVSPIAMLLAPDAVAFPRVLGPIAMVWDAVVRLTPVLAPIKIPPEVAKAPDPTVLPPMAVLFEPMIGPARALLPRAVL